MPEAVSRISTGPTVLVDNSLENQVKNSIIPANHRPIDPMQEPLPSRPPVKRVPSSRPILVTPEPTSLSGPALSKLEIKPELLANGTHLMGHSVEDLAAATNISVETIQAAILLRQQQLMNQHKVAISTRRPITTTSTTTFRPIVLPSQKIAHKQVF